MNITDLDLQLSKELHEALLEGRIEPSLVEEITITVDGQRLSVWRYNEAEVDSRLARLRDAGYEDSPVYKELYDFHQKRRAGAYGTVDGGKAQVSLKRPHCCVCPRDANVQAKDGVWYCGEHWDAWMAYYGAVVALNPLKSPEVIWEEWYDAARVEQDKVSKAEAWV